MYDYIFFSWSRFSSGGGVTRLGISIDPVSSLKERKGASDLI